MARFESQICAMQLVVADLRPHETVGAFGQEEEDDDDEETKSDLAKPLSSYISTAVDDAV